MGEWVNGSARLVYVVRNGDLNSLGRGVDSRVVESATCQGDDDLIVSLVTPAVLRDGQPQREHGPLAHAAAYRDVAPADVNPLGIRMCCVTGSHSVDMDPSPTRLRTVMRRGP